MLSRFEVRFPKLNYKNKSLELHHSFSYFGVFLLKPTSKVPKILLRHTLVSILLASMSSDVKEQTTCKIVQGNFFLLAALSSHLVQWRCSTHFLANKPRSFHSERAGNIGVLEVARYMIVLVVLHLSLWGYQVF